MVYSYWDILYHGRDDVRKYFDIVLYRYCYCYCYFGGVLSSHPGT